MKLIQVDYDRELGKEGKERERARYCGMGREGENGDEERKWCGSLKEVKPWLILTDGLNKHMGIFGYRE